MPHAATEPFVPRFKQNRSNKQRNLKPEGWIRAICLLLGSTIFLAFSGSSRAAEATQSPSPEVTAGSDSDSKLSLKGKTIGITVIGTDHYWDLRCYQAQIDEVKRLGGASIALDAGRDDNRQISQIQTLIGQKPDAIIEQLGTLTVLEPWLAVGTFNAFLIAVLGITPFLATLGTLFIGESVQQLATNGGQPIYLITGNLPAGFTFIGRGILLGVPFPFYIVGASIVAFFLLIHATRFGRQIIAFGAKAGVAWYSGVRVRHLSAWVYILSAIVCGIAGIVLSSTVKAYVPLSGNAYLLDAIGATFIGTTLHPLSRPSVVGTVLGVLLLAIVTNGLLLVGWNFYWQQVARGLLIFGVLAVSFLGRRFQT
jgi:ribose/xylose/arabinose/galactoside ABC-type transport system permease subunit